MYIGQKPCIQIDDRREVRLTPVHAGGRIWTDVVGKKLLDWFGSGKMEGKGGGLDQLHEKNQRCQMTRTWVVV
jgi:hypothetical protein